MLDKKREDLEKISGWGKQSTDNVLKAVEGVIIVVSKVYVSLLTDI